MFKLLVARWMCKMLSPVQGLKLAPLVVCMPHTPVEVYEAFLTQQLEARASEPSRLPGSGVGRNQLAMRNLLEAALSEHGAHATGLWLTAIAWYANVEDFAMASAVHARALRSLDSPLRDGFAEQAQVVIRGGRL